MPRKADTWISLAALKFGDPSRSVRRPIRQPLVVLITVTPPSGVTPELARMKPLPLARVHFIPAVRDRQVKRPRVMDVPYARVGVLAPALERHFPPVHSFNVLSAPRVTDRAGTYVRHSVSGLRSDGPESSI